MMRMTQETHQQVKFLRRLMCLMAVLLMMVFRLAITGLVLASPETVSTNQPTRFTRYELVHFQITEFKDCALSK